MYISEAVKGQLREYDGKAITIDALEVEQPTNPGDGLIRRFRVLGPAQQSPNTIHGTELSAQLVNLSGSTASIELAIRNIGDTSAGIDISQIGFAVLSERIEGLPTPSDGPSTAVITRVDLFSKNGRQQYGIDDKIYSYSYVVRDHKRL